MPARKRRIRHDQDTRNKIQATQLINRLYKCAMGEVDMDSQQVTAAKTLLAKVLPDLQSVEANITGTQHVVRSEPMSVEEWAKQYVTQRTPDEPEQLTHNGHAHEDADGDTP